MYINLLEGQVVASQASVDKQTKLSKPEEGTSQSSLAVLLGWRGVSNSVHDSSERPDETESRAEQRVAETANEQSGKGNIVVLEVVTVGTL